MSTINKGIKKGNFRSVVKIWITIGLSLIMIVAFFLYFITHNKSYQNAAVEQGDNIYLNGIRYHTLSWESKDYTITNILICKTDRGMKLYKTEEYPDYEYIAGYRLWDGEIYKKDAENEN